jgi:hypothetical protein
MQIMSVSLAKSSPWLLEDFVKNSRKTKTLRSVVIAFGEQDGLGAWWKINLEIEKVLPRLASAIKP